MLALKYEKKVRKDSNFRKVLADLGEEIKPLYENKQIIVLNDLCTRLIQRESSCLWQNGAIWSSAFSWTWPIQLSEARLRSGFVSRVLLLFSKTWFVAIVLNFSRKISSFLAFENEKGACSGSESIHFHIPQLRLNLCFQLCAGSLDNR